MIAYLERSIRNTTKRIAFHHRENKPVVLFYDDKFSAYLKGTLNRTLGSRFEGVLHCLLLHDRDSHLLSSHVNLCSYQYSVIFSQPPVC